MLPPRAAGEIARATASSFVLEEPPPPPGSQRPRAVVHCHHANHAARVAWQWELQLVGAGLCVTARFDAAGGATLEGDVGGARFVERVADDDAGAASSEGECAEPKLAEWLRALRGAGDAGDGACDYEDALRTLEICATCEEATD